MAGLLTGEVMDEAALLMNDSAKVTWTYAVQFPWLKRAVDDLSNELDRVNIPLLRKVSLGNVITAITGVTLAMPADCVVPVQLEERLNGSTDRFVGMTEVGIIPTGASQDTSLNIWAFQGTLLNSVPVIDLLGATTTREVKITYIRFLPHTGITSSGTDDLSTYVTFRSKTALSARVAGYLARYVLQNKKKADDLDMDYGKNIDSIVRRWIKKRQSRPVKKPSFRRMGFGG